RRLAVFLSIALSSTLATSQAEQLGGPWQQQNTGVDVQLRGISAVSSDIAWASGAKGTVLRTVDGGQHWEKVSVPNAEALDFRDVQAFAPNTAFVLSIGPGEQSRIYQTSDGGKHWQLQFTNKDPKAFYDCFAFWDDKHGIALSDSVDGKFPLIATTDGINWNPVAVKEMPAALPSEGAFAASGTCIATFGKNDVWFATGGPAARVFHSSDRGATWTAAETPILHGAASQGIFSVVFWSHRDGLIVGGDYQDSGRTGSNAAVTHNGGKSWKLSARFPQGYRSGLGMWTSPKMIWVAVGTSGTDFSDVGGLTWSTARFDDKPWTHSDAYAYNAVSCSKTVCWAVGPYGRIGWLREPRSLIQLK
ncbi:MAG TPA: YCF48-related protein, partial [Candidatus Angelobacter sp.]